MRGNIMKKRNLFLGIGLGTAVAAGCAIIKNLIDQHQDEDLNDQEISKISLEEQKDKKNINNDVPNLKADAINDGYKPIKY